MQPQSNTEEIWKPIPGFAVYAVSNHGRVKRIDQARGSRPGKVRKIMVNPVTGYSEVMLCINYVKTMCRVHRLVGAAFLGLDLDSSDEINHDDGDKQNNNDWNLEITDRSGNVTHSYRELGRVGSNTVLTAEQVLEIRRLRAEGMSCPKIAKIFNTGYKNVHKIVTGQRWKYLNES